MGEKGSIQSQIIMTAKVVYRIHNGYNVKFELKLELNDCFRKKRLEHSLRICHGSYSKSVTEPWLEFWFSYS